MKIRTPAKKYRFMIGTTSRVPRAPGWHYLILDIDQKEIPDPLFQFLHDCESEFQMTKKGWHIFTNVKMRLKPMLTLSVQLGADKTWAKLALDRGWAFLADKGPVKLPWPVERKVIGWKKPGN